MFKFAQIFEVKCLKQIRWQLPKCSTCSEMPSDIVTMPRTVISRRLLHYTKSLSVSSIFSRLCQIVSIAVNVHDKLKLSYLSKF